MKNIKNKKKSIQWGYVFYFVANMVLVFCFDIIAHLDISKIALNIVILIILFSVWAIIINKLLEKEELIHVKTLLMFVMPFVMVIATFFAHFVLKRLSATDVVSIVSILISLATITFTIAIRTLKRF